MMQKANRKSHLQAPLSPATQAMLRSEGPFSSGPSPNKAADSKTPTSGEIPIAASAGTQATAFLPEPGVHRVMSAEVNGSGSHNGYSSPHDRPGYPPRTSSTSVLPTKSERGSMQSMVMPIRPAPPPAGPLPHTPGSRDSMRRYPHGEGQMI
jgi:hypothetical protein